MSQYPIGNLGQPFREKDLHDLLLDLAAKQEVTEQLIISTRTGKWHARISKLRRVSSQNTRSMIRSMARFVAEGLRRDTGEGLGFGAHEDSGSILVEDLRLHGPKKLSERWDVVVSWGASQKDLDKEIDSVRACLDALGIFDDTEIQVQELHGKAETWVGDIRVQEDRVHHERTVSGRLNVSRIVAAMGHALPGLSKLEISGKVKTKIPYEDSREKFIAALLALQWQSNGKLPECNSLHEYRSEWEKNGLDAEMLQERWRTVVGPAREFLTKSLAAIDPKMRAAFSVHPAGRNAELTYELILRSLQKGYFGDAVDVVQHLQHPILPVARAMGETYFLFAANVIMQAQIAWFERDLERVLKERFGQELRRDPAAEASAPAATAAGISGSDIPRACQVTPPPPSAGQRPRRPRP